jgi:hypothetical protein
VPGNTCVTVPSVTICSSLGIAPRYLQRCASQLRAEHRMGSD